MMLELIWIHFIADFLLQSHKMSINKSKNFYWLCWHCIIYGLPFLLFGLNFALAVIGWHLIIDFVTSKITSRLWKANEYHWFFCVIGFDQALHLTILYMLANGNI